MTTGSFLNFFSFSEKRKFCQIVNDDPDILETLGKAKPRRKSASHKTSSSLYDEDDDEFSPTVKEKERKIREKRKEAAKRVQEGDYLTNMAERTKVFKSRKDSLVTKLAETDSVCGTRSFLVVINMDHDSAFYHGDPKLVTRFFTGTGISDSMLSKSYNVRSVRMILNDFE